MFIFKEWEKTFPFDPEGGASNIVECLACHSECRIHLNLPIVIHELDNLCKLHCPRCKQVLAYKKQLTTRYVKATTKELLKYVGALADLQYDAARSGDGLVTTIPTCDVNPYQIVHMVCKELKL